MSEQKTLLSDLLSDITRKQRRSLLLVSAIGIAIVRSGLVPTRITALGIEFSQTEMSLLLAFIGLVILYFIITFCIYASSDFLEWRRLLPFQIQRNLLSWDREHAAFWDKIDEDRRTMITEEIIKQTRYHAILRPFFDIISFLRFVIDFIVPPAVSIYGMVILFSY